MTKIGFVGVGMMGHGMAKNLMKAGNDLTVIAHRNRAPVDDLVGLGALESPKLAGVSASSDIIFFCLSNSSVVEAVVAELKPDLRAGQIIIDATTARPQSTVALQEELKELGVHFVDAPITANPEKAELGQLTSLVGAAHEVFRQVEP
ncbi:MAG: NAD(P)-binding domain-containing protein [Pseudomonadota bacterium]|nr:NAD(P)-binding domain-containing protein [Pseudomonadota bacterium]